MSSKHFCARAGFGYNLGQVLKISRRWNGNNYNNYA